MRDEPSSEESMREESMAADSTPANSWHSRWDWDRHPHCSTEAHETALACVEAGIVATLPDNLVETALAVDGDELRIGETSYDLSAFDRIVVLGGGKASGGLAAALEIRLGDRLNDGVVVSTDDPDTHTVRIVDGDHPTPSERNVDATTQLLELAGDADEDTLVLATITGGASALLCAPATELSLEEMRQTNDALLKSGASIDEINAVRKHLSAIKGGHLARVASPATLATLAISDVVGDDPSVIGSGPTVPDETTFEDALAVFDRYDLRSTVPETVLDRLMDGLNGDVDETPAVGATAFEKTTYHVLANGRTALDAAADVAEKKGYGALVLSSRLRGEARESGRLHAGIAEEIVATGDPIDPPAVVLSGGEVTVTVRGDGLGGPNQELALATAIEFTERTTDAVLASVDTDGIDGPTDVCGAIVDDKTLSRKRNTNEPSQGTGETDRESTVDLRPAREALATNDVTPFLDSLDALLETGYTGTNVNDLRALVVDSLDEESS